MAVHPEMISGDDRPLFNKDMAVPVRVKQTALDPAGLIVIDEALDLDKNMDVHALIPCAQATSERTSFFIDIITFPLTLHEITRMQGRQLLRLGF